MSDLVPTERLVIDYDDFPGVGDDAFNEYANQRIEFFAGKLVRAGERPWFEVWYLNVPGRANSTEDDFDAVEVTFFEGQASIQTLRPYAELKGAPA